MSRIVRSVALIPSDGERSQWLALWNANRNSLGFVTGEPQQGESFRECVHRQCCDDLGLAPSELLVSSVPQLNLDINEVLPGDVSPTHATVAFYLVHPYRKVARQKVNALDHAHWLRGKELLDGSAEDGTPVDPVLTHFLRRADVIQPW